MSASVIPTTPTAAPSGRPWRVIVAWASLAFIPVDLVVGFVLGYAIGLDPSIDNPVTGWNAFWRVVVLWLIVAASAIVGLVCAIAAHRRHEPSATAAIVVTGLVFAVLTFITLVTGTLSAFWMTP